MKSRVLVYSLQPESDNLYQTVQEFKNMIRQLSTVMMQFTCITSSCDNRSEFKSLVVASLWSALHSTEP